MKTTLIIEDDLYELLERFSRTTTKSRRKLSQTLNRILGEYFGKKQDLFGSTKIPRHLLLKDLREKHDRFD